ncbi:MAG: hypothetical protein WBD40_08750, partial [Tepidisphaeraceae bacterium]
IGSLRRPRSAAFGQPLKRGPGGLLRFVVAPLEVLLENFDGPARGLAAALLGGFFQLWKDRLAGFLQLLGSLLPLGELGGVEILGKQLWRCFLTGGLARPDVVRSTE